MLMFLGGWLAGIATMVIVTVALSWYVTKHPDKFA